MSEKLKRSDFEQLVDSIWDLGKIAMRDLIKMAQPPAMVKGTLTHGNLELEPAFQIWYPGIIQRLSRWPRIIELDISEAEPYGQDNSFTFYETQRLSLDAVNLTHTFSRQQSIVRGGESITFYADELAVGERSRAGDPEWHQEKEEVTGEMAQLDVDARVDHVEKIYITPETILALQKLAHAGYSAIFVTNQVGIAEGRMSLDEFWQVHQAVLDELEPAGLPILKTYVCPHQDSDDCECRKPKPKLLLDAINDFDFDHTQTFMVGDRPTDVQAGRAAGTKTIFLKTTPHGNDGDTGADYAAEDILAAVDYILG
jgi:D-glycero-D-manno-heptose 1,7-bisphosphate phosphatase